MRGGDWGGLHPLGRGDSQQGQAFGEQAASGGEQGQAGVPQPGGGGVSKSENCSVTYTRLVIG